MCVSVHVYDVSVGKSWCVCVSACVMCRAWCQCVCVSARVCVWCQCVQVCGCSVAVHVCVVLSLYSVWMCSMSGCLCMWVCVSAHVCQCVCKNVTGILMCCVTGQCRCQVFLPAPVFDTTGQVYLGSPLLCGKCLPSLHPSLLFHAHACRLQTPPTPPPLQPPHTCTHMHTCIHIHGHTLIHVSHMTSHTHTHTVCLIYTPSVSHTHTLCLTQFVSHTHAVSHTLPVSHTVFVSHTCCLSLTQNWLNKYLKISFRENKALWGNSMELADVIKVPAHKPFSIHPHLILFFMGVNWPV